MEDLVTLKEAIANNEFSTIKRIGHRIKGSAKSYGFANVGDLSSDLETAAEQGLSADCRILIEKIEEEILLAKKSFESPPEASS